MTTAQSLAEANERSVVQLFALLDGFPGIDYNDGADCITIRTTVPHPLVNVVLRSRHAPNTADSSIQSTISHFTCKNLPFAWMVNSASAPKELPGMLVRNGLYCAAQMPGMALELAKLRTPTLNGLNCRIVEVNHKEIDDWISVCSTGSNVPPEVINIFRPVMGESNFRNGVTVRVFLALLNDMPVGTSMLSMDGETAGIYCVAVLPEARRQGIGAAVTSHALTVARNLGCRHAILQASKMGESIYRNLGFETCCEYSTYALSL